MQKPYCTAALLCTFLAAISFAAPVPVTITVQADTPAHAISPMLHGVFFEDINYAADGGLYAELLQNRSFEHGDAFVGWGLVNRGATGTSSIESADPVHLNNPHYVRLRVSKPGQGFGLANYGFAGIPVRSGEKYLLSLRARAKATIPLQVTLEDESGRVLGTAELNPDSTRWQTLETEITAAASASNARLTIVTRQAGELDLDVVSLFPRDTFRQRRNGMRSDIAQKIADLQPAFLRFPGGCIVEGNTLANRYQWKDSIGDIAERKQNGNRWQDAIRGREAPHYYQSYGLGFFEYFQFIEDIGAAPVPVLNVGMACQYQSKELVPLDELQPYVQDALDLIEFANGPVTSTWGAKRAAMGHPAPFNLRYIGIGNEQWGAAYFERYNIFVAAIHARYPDIQLVSGSGPGVDDESWALAWRRFRSDTPAHVVDEHYYRPPQWFLENASRYDRQSRTCPTIEHGTCPKVFAGEFAAHDTASKKPSLRAAIAEAAFMTGLLRNSDLVVMSSYAPLLARAGAYQWAPDLIWFDNERVFGTPSYYVQQLFSRYRPDVSLPVTVAGDPVTLPPLPAKAVATYGADPLPPYAPDSIPTLYAAAGSDSERNELVLFLVNPFAETRDASIELKGAHTLGKTVSVTRLTSGSADDVNSFETPEAVSPRQLTSEITGSKLRQELPPNSLTILRVPAQGA
ncbi:MAG TPA: alpha-L-arabinofuranosidase C-terminal domain-containing protein, partial [Povalibacter sp.]